MLKTEIDIKKLENAANRLRAIAHPMRIAIIALLENDIKLNVTEIYLKLHIEQAAASHHLNILKNKGVLSSKEQANKLIIFLKMILSGKFSTALINADTDKIVYLVYIKI